MAGDGKGIALAGMATGILFAYSGIAGKSLTQALQYLIQGKNPAGSPLANPITGGSPDISGTSAVSPPPLTAVGSSSGQAALHDAAAAYGWGSGAQWQALNAVEMAEAGYNPNARNPSSGAYGLAQALGHGTARSAAANGENNYGGFGLSDAEAQAANSGDAGAQAIWMCAYIKATYGDPVNAWAHEQASHWY